MGLDGSFPRQFLNPFLERLSKSHAAVLNTGAHFQDAETIIKNLKIMYTFLESKKSNVKIMWRTVVPGHDNCMKYKVPLTYDPNISANSYQWEKFPSQNKEVLEFMRKQKNTYIVDVYRMTRYRPDGHRSSGDCLHYYLPSVVD